MDDPAVALVISAQGGSKEAFGTLVELHWARLVRLARSVVGELDAEDVAQESLVVAWRKLHELNVPARFPSWLSRIVFRRCLRRARQAGRLVPLETVREPAHDGDPIDRLVVWQLLGRLAPRQRAVLHLTVVEGMTDGEIAGALGITAGSVRAHRKRARNRIATLLTGGAA
ncbi:MAG: RNA polymerase sigma factor [Acidobacteriota bacterium]